ncbi:MAG TPA: TlpA disulfide reductase family protein [Chthonomonadales bacterium]|nr:TlpA disulfide reductase family protein [Chthonomonadales bacterium]
MNRSHRVAIGLVLPVLLAAASTGAPAQTVRLTLRPSGAMEIVGGYIPNQLELSSQKPAAVTRAPSDLGDALYGTLTLGPRESPTHIQVAVDETAGRAARLYVDTNSNGDLTDDPAAEWTAHSYKSQDGKTYTMYMGGANVTVKYGSGPVTMHLGMYRFDRNEPARAQFRNTLFFYPDYGYEGTIKLGGKRYKAMLADDYATGDFRGGRMARGSGITLHLDVNGNGKFERMGETFDAAKPFNIHGVTYEIANMDPSGATFKIIKSSKSVPEILPPQDLSVGKKAIAFTAATTSGASVAFPSSYKGHIVMLDFWATWCGPCRGEIPGLSKAYAKYHSKGFDVLGISLDQPNAGAALAAFTQKNGMPWPQVYDGKFWSAAVAQKYDVDSIPAAFLVDGDTGKILASGDSLRGASLEKTITAALAAHSRS